MNKEEYIREVQLIKGKFLGDLAHIELLISLIVSHYIDDTGEKKDLLMFILNKVNLKDKLIILSDLLDKDTKLSNYSYKDLIKDIQELNTLRNLLAHSMIDTGKLTDSNFDIIYLLSSNKLNEASRTYSFQKYESDKKRINLVGNTLYKMRQEQRQMQ